jgi:predicted DNA-binding transcriptional regulator YafY
VNELCDDLDCHPRTVYRDLDALQAAGFPLVADRQNGTTRWALMESARGGFVVPFALPELMALYFSREVIGGLKGTVFHEALESVFRKVRATLPSESLRFLSQAEKSVSAGIGPHKPHGFFRETLRLLGDAVINHRVVEIVYHTLSRRQTSRRQIEPYKLWYFDGTFYLIGHCRLKKEIRIFAVDRFREIVVSDEVFDIPAQFNIKSFMRNSFGTFTGEPVRMRVWFDPAAAGYVREKIWHVSQKLHERKDGSLVFEAEVAGTQEIKRWVMRFGSKARVLEPESLRVEIRMEAAEMLASYSNKPFSQKKALAA